MHSASEVLTFVGLLLVVGLGVGIWIGSSFRAAVEVVRQAKNDRPDYPFAYDSRGREVSGVPAAELLDERF